MRNFILYILYILYILSIDVTLFVKRSACNSCSSAVSRVLGVLADFYKNAKPNPLSHTAQRVILLLAQARKIATIDDATCFETS